MELLPHIEPLGFEYFLLKMQSFLYYHFNINTWKSSTHWFQNWDSLFLKKHTVSCKICIDYFHVHGVISPLPSQGKKKSVICYLMQLNMGNFLALLAKFTILFR